MADNEKSFTAEEVNKIVAERLLRQKKNDTALEELKKVLLELKKEGKLSESSVANLARELADMAQSGANEAENVEAADKVAANSDENGNSAAENGINGAEGVTETAADETPANSAEEKFAAEIAELSEVHPELDVNGLLNDGEFAKFYAAFTADIPDATLLAAYEAYSEAKAIEKRVRAASSLKRTPVMQSARQDAGQNLTERQRNIARHAGMSYKEYAELLSEIPKRKLR